MGAAAALLDSQRRRWPRRLLQAAVVAGLLVAVAWPSWYHWQAWRQWRAATAAIDREEWAAALEHLQPCQQYWKRDPQVHLQLARLYRINGQPEAARRHLQEARRRDAPPEVVELEDALQRYWAGEESVEPYLLARLHDDPAAARWVLPVLVPRMFALFRLQEAGYLSAMWVEQSPHSPEAWRFRAEILTRLHPDESAITAWRTCISLAPHRPEFRRGLASLLLHKRLHLAEAREQLQTLLVYTPGDRQAQWMLAECYLLEGNTAAARRCLEELPAAPDDPQFLLLRGQLALHEGRPHQAAEDLQASVARDPSSPTAWYTLLQALQQVGADPATLRAAEERWRQCDADLRRVGQLVRQVSEQPRDPELRRQIGELFLRHARDEEGLRWLQSALHVQPGHAATHRTLADYYRRRGQTERAEYHLRFGTTVNPSQI